MRSIKELSAIVGTVWFWGLFTWLVFMSGKEEVIAVVPPWFGLQIKIMALLSGAFMFLWYLGQLLTHYDEDKQ